LYTLIRRNQSIPRSWQWWFLNPILRRFRRAAGCDKQTHRQSNTYASWKRTFA